MKNIIFIAPPAAGKGTQSDMLSEKYNIPHISVGKLLRDEVAKGNEHSNYISEQMNHGKLVKDSIVLEVLLKRLLQSDCNNGFIIDGFPRDLNQAIAFEEKLKKINKRIGIVFVLDLDETIAQKRMIGRSSCPNCGLVYNDNFNNTKSKVKGICDKCYTPLVKRADDNIETFNERYQVYLDNSTPIIKHYEDMGILHHIDSSIDKDHTFKQIDEILNKKDNL